MSAKNTNRFSLQPIPTCSRNRLAAVALDLKGRGKYEQRFLLTE